MLEERHSDPVQREFSVLLADQQPVDALKRVLEHEGFAIFVATTVQSAISLANSHFIDAAITDLRFDDGIGLEVVEALAIRNPNCRVLVHSAYADLAMTVRAIKMGARDVLPKPSNTELLKTTLLEQKCRWVEESQLMSPLSVRDNYIRHILLECDGKLSSAARRLSMHRRTLQRLIHRRPGLRRFENELA